MGPPPGEYVFKDLDGGLSIRRVGSRELRFDIWTIGGNGHQCGVSGVIRGTIGRADSWAEDGAESNCKISFSYSNSEVVVTPITETECHDYCGARAFFAGTYRLPPASCTDKAKQAKRDDFLKLYRAKRYPQAVNTLQTLMTQCTEFMNWIEVDQVRNDLALAHYHNGDYAQCLTTLNETRAGKVKNEQEYKEVATGFDHANYIEVAKATWYNKALCTKAMTKGR